jgi:hypothetical protein
MASQAARIKSGDDFTVTTTSSLTRCDFMALIYMYCFVSFVCFVCVCVCVCVCFAEVCLFADMCLTGACVRVII